MNNLKKLIKINSYENKDEIIEFLVKELKNKAKEIKIVTNKENTNKSLLIGINTQLADCFPIVLSGHLDTVSPSFEEYETDPFELTEKDGKFYGLGSIDMKSFAAVILDKFD